MEMKIVIWE